MNSNNDILTQLSQQWREERGEATQAKESAASLINKASFTQIASLKMHLTTIIILSITLAVIYSFYLWVANFQTALSLVGGLMMLGALVARIAIEILSLCLLTQIDVGLNTVDSNRQSIRFHSLRRVIHGSFMYATLALYAIGFLLLTPEFLDYLEPSMVIVMNLSFLVGGGVLLKYLRIKVQEESEVLRVMRETQCELLNSSW